MFITIILGWIAAVLCILAGMNHAAKHRLKKQKRQSAWMKLIMGKHHIWLGVLMLLPALGHGVQSLVHCRVKSMWFWCNVGLGSASFISAVYLGYTYLVRKKRRGWLHRHKIVGNLLVLLTLLHIFVANVGGSVIALIGSGALFVVWLVFLLAGHKTNE